MKRFFVSLGFFAIVVIGFFFWWNNGLKAVNPSSKSTKIFVIRQGENVREIAQDLKKDNLIKDPVVFFLLVKKMGIEGKIQAGDFRLSPSMTAEELAKNLTHGTLDIWVTIPEGKRSEEVAEALKEKLPSSYSNLWKNELIKHEGYLFPDTYLIPKNTTIDQIASIMKGTFERKFSELPKSSEGFTKDQIVIIASLVEREAKFQEDRPLVASVILNRLRINMPLQIDATVQYALGYQEEEKTWWKKNLTKEDIKIDSSYNTYKNVGLPPSPIANPGLDVLKAVVSPSQTDYLYYLSDKSGRNHYAKTIEEHNENIKKFRL